MVREEDSFIIDSHILDSYIEVYRPRSIESLIKVIG